MEIHPSFVLMLPLKQIALRRIAAGLWTEPDILTLIGKYRELMGLGDWRGKWHVIECKVSEKISKLQLPESLKEDILQILKPMGLQIRRWKTFHEFRFAAPEFAFPLEYFDVPVLEKLQWTASITIDYRNTAEELVRCGVFDILKRYKIACLYCLDHYIPDLWEELPQKDKICFYDEDISHMASSLLPFYWPYMLKGEENKLDDILSSSHREPTTYRQHTFTYSLLDGNKAAAEYFLQVLSPEERETSLNKIVHNFLIGKFEAFPSSFPKENVAEVLIFLLAQMTSEQRVQIFRKRPVEVLGRFLCWPWHEVFSDIADAMWTWIRCEDLECRANNYDSLLDKLQSSVQYSDGWFPSLYQNFFLNCPIDFKKYFVDQECQERRYRTFFAELFEAEDAETINVILKNVDARDRLRLVLSEHILKRFCYAICKDRGHLVEMCLRETGMSKEDNESLKEAFKEILKRENRESIESPKWKIFFEFLDETESRAQSKRKTGNGTLTEAKKVFSVMEENSATK